MLTLYYLSGALATAIIITVGLLLHFKASQKLNIFLKTISLILATLLFFRFMGGSDVIEDVVNLTPTDGMTTPFLVGLALAQVWLAYAVEMLVILASFFNVKTTPALLAYVGNVVFVLNFAMLSNYLSATTGIVAVETFHWRALLIALETGVGLGYSVVFTVANAKQLKLKGKELFWFAIAVVGVISASFPAYGFSVWTDPARYPMVPLDLKFYHRLVFYPAVVTPIVIYLFIKDLPLETRRFVLMYVAWTGLLNFSVYNKFDDLFGPSWVTSWPFHLCNTAMYVTPLCLTFKWKKVFYFTYFINVLGAFFALAMPNYSDSTTLFSLDLWRFYVNHYQAFYMPLLVVGVGIFRRPRFKEFTYSMVGFGVYYLAMIVVNAWFTNYDPNVDYFFINSNFIADKLGTWAENLRIATWEFDLGNLHFKLYPVYQTLYFVVYIAMALGMWFLYEMAYNTIVGWQDIALRNKKVKADRLALESQLNGRSIELPMNEQNTNKLVLKNFTKRYGKSDVYAVKDANLEVVGGEIYGFLGPNGAGKSTIIKSIVGIQTITDGAIEVCGYDVATQSVMAKRQIGFVPDHYALYERLTAREYINYIADLYGVSESDRTERLNKYIEIFEFQSAIDNPIKTYSHGMKQKVTIMSALIHNPKVWILDEPLTGLDPNSIFQVKECMKQHAKEGNIVFFSSHIIDVVERICDKIAIIRKGQIQCVRDVHQMERDGESLEQFYMEVINGHDVQPIAVNTPQEG